MVRPWHERVVVVTGAGSGLGRQMALDLAKKGCRLAIADINEVALAESERLALQAGAMVEAVVIDTADWNQVQILAARTLERFGRLDAWINNAAVTVYAEFEQLPLDEFRRVIDVNLMGYAHGLKVAIAAMRQSGGVIVCVGSVVAERAVPLQSAYSASTFAVKGLIESVRAEILHHQLPIQLCQVEPASIDTPFLQHAKSHLAVQPKPLGWVYDPEVVSRAVIRCIEKPQRDVVVGGQGALLKWSEQWTPAGVDRYMATWGYRGQQTDQPPASDSRDQLFGSSHQPSDIHGGYGGLRHSPATWASQHPAVVWGTVAGMALGWWLTRRSAA